MRTGAAFGGSNAAVVHPHGVRQELSAKADITFSEPRIHSPWLGRRVTDSDPQRASFAVAGAPPYRIRSSIGIIRRGWGAAISGQNRD